MSFSLQNCFLSFVILSFATSINAVPVMDAEGLNSTVSNVTMPDPVNANMTYIFSTPPPIELITFIDLANPRNARSEDEPVSDTVANNTDQEKAKSSAIQFPKDESSSPKMIYSPVTEEDNLTVSMDMDSNNTNTEVNIETSSSSSSTNIDLLSTTQKPLTVVNSTEIVSSSTSNSSIADSEVRVGRSQPDEIEDEINTNLTQTLAALTTLSSIINQTSVNVSLLTVV